MTISIIYKQIRIPIPTKWVVVYGPTADITPMSYDIDKEDTDSSVSQQEELREYMKNNLGRINQVERLYSDVTDMPPGTSPGADLKNVCPGNGDKLLTPQAGWPCPDLFDGPALFLGIGFWLYAHPVFTECI